MKEEIILGLDVGIASVGWCITNKKDNSIIKHGVRLFDTVDDPKDSKLLNDTRRQKRSERRMKKRKNVLKRDFIKFLIENEYIKDIEIKNFENKQFVEDFREKFLKPIDQEMNKKYSNEKLYWIHILRKKALTEKIEFNQFISILYWYLSNRGFKYEEFDDKETKGWKILQKDKKGKLPIDLLIEEFDKTGRTKSFFNRNFHKKDYLKELKIMFETQGIDEKITNSFLNESSEWKETGFFNRQRSFEIGPGGEKSPTIYGLYAKNGDGQIVKKYENIWEKTIGKCSLYKKEDRAPKGSFSAEIFNLLNDLNNIYFGLEKKKLTEKDKLEILKLSLNGKANLKKTIAYIVNNYENTDKDNIFGFRIDKKKQSLLTEINSYFIFCKLFDPIEFNFNNFENFIKQINENKVDTFINILNKTKEIEKRNAHIFEEFKIKFDNEELFKRSQKIKSSETHSLSYKALQEYIPELIKQKENYSTLSYEKRELERKKDSSLTKYLDKKWIKESITSPSVKRGLFQTTGLLNEIIKYCDNNNLHIYKIVVEMVRETNNKKQKENITNFQSHLEEKNKEVSDLLGSHSKTKGKSKKSGIFQKVYLYKTQDTFDIYDGLPIDWADLLANPLKYDIDHILPKSKSFDNSINNKVLTKNIHNSKKGNKTPYKWLSDDKFHELAIKWRDIFNNEKNPKNKNIKKLQNLVSIVDFDDPNQQLEFIQRNLVDTSYIAKATMNKLKDFFLNKNTIIQTVNGKMTSFSRKYVESLGENLLRPEGCGDSRDEKTGMKNRIWHGHHAEDAYFITLLSQTYKDSKIIEKYAHAPKINDSKNTNLSFPWEKKYEELYKNLQFGKKELDNKFDQIQFSRKLELNSQLKACNEELIGAKMLKNNKGEDYLKSFKYYKLIEMEKIDCEKYFNSSNKKSNDVALKEENINLYNSICDVYKANKESQLPFKVYLKEKNNLKFIYKNKNKKNIESIVNKVKIFKSDKKIDDIFFGKNKNKNSFYQGLNWLELHIYKNTKDNYEIIPINIKNAVFGNNKFKIKLNELNKMKESKNIDTNNKPLWIFKKNDIILKDGIEYFICGHSWTYNKLELKYLFKNEEKRMQKTINTFLLNSQLLKKDFMGNILKKTNIFIK